MKQPGRTLIDGGQATLGRKFSGGSISCASASTSAPALESWAVELSRSVARGRNDMPGTSLAMTV